MKHAVLIMLPYLILAEVLVLIYGKYGLILHYHSNCQNNNGKYCILLEGNNNPEYLAEACDAITAVKDLTHMDTYDLMLERLLLILDQVSTPT